MTQIKLDPNRDFVVQESVTLNYVLGFLLLGVFVGALVLGDLGWSNSLMAGCFFGLPAAYYFSQATKKAASIRINIHGFYYAGKLVATWEYFAEARIIQELAPGSIQDNFQLLFRYYNAQRTLLYFLKIPMSNTQDKADEEIVEAIHFYYHASREATYPQEESSRATSGAGGN